MLVWILLAFVVITVAAVLLLRKTNSEPASPKITVSSDTPDWLRKAIESAPPPKTEMRLVAKCDFENLERCMDICELTLQTSTGNPREPTSATWASRENRVDYVFHPEIDLRTLHITGPTAEYVRNDILNLAYLPTLEMDIPNLLASSDPIEILRGVGAAAFMAGVGRGHYYASRVEALCQHTDPRVRDSAKQALPKLAG